VQVTCRIDGQRPPGGKGPVVPKGAEAVQDTLLPLPARAGRELVGSAAASVALLAAAAVICGAVEVALSIDDRRRIRISPVALVAGKLVQHLEFPAVGPGRQLESGAVEIAGLVHNDASVSLLAATRLEAIEDVQIPSAGTGRQLENRTVFVGATAVGGRDVKVASSVHDRRAGEVVSAGIVEPKAT